MNVLFLSLLDFSNIEESNIYTDLLRKFKEYGHKIYVVSPVERRKHRVSEILGNDGVKILKPKILNIQKTNLIEKGISTILLEYIILCHIKRYFSDVKFDLVIYATPPVTFEKIISFVKRRDSAYTYLLLKDIFPQNAVDMGMLSQQGWKKFLLNFFRIKEKKLYEISDKIGCMSEANKKFILKNNPEIKPEAVEVCPNSIEPIKKEIKTKDLVSIRKKYNLPSKSRIFIYGGNLGRPQGVKFIIECLKTQLGRKDRYFLIIGNGTEFKTLEEFIKQYRTTNIELRQGLPKNEYDEILSACDVGLIFLDYNFTIPNFPSRLLSYMQYSKPVLAATDMATDVGSTILEGNFGWWVPSNEVEKWSNMVEYICGLGDIKELGKNAFNYLNDYFSVENSYRIIMNSAIGNKV